ncbi:AAA family ATPase [Pseudonocardia acaciae]|uniref:bifunctional aminoglycoside phosphotransferase/ATP-binding protein n=1 Tax=Pseudonocardia acaciae TaxID=551276 RepID=UPI0007E8D3FC|nr:AAA family ATPase [Pseudonocardia acaciae]
MGAANQTDPTTETTERSPFAACHETHIGVVFLVGDRAYKLKKPVRTGFLDFTTRSARLAACRREVELNRRLAPDVYLGVSDISDPVTGGPADHLVVMRRMPARRRLSTLVSAGEPVSDALRALARRLAAFHARAERGPAISAAATASATRGRWLATLERLERFRGRPLDEAVYDDLARLAPRFTAGREPLFAARCAAGRAVDGHGDLLADDIFCLPDGPRALDCLEFDDGLRHVDGLDDAAFLAMDLERLGRADLGARFLDDYAEFAGDPAPASLRHHYVAYRACVRTLVNCLKAEQGNAEAQALVGRHADLSARHLHRGAVRLALVGGLPGTGKSTLAGALADRMGAVLISSDRLRKEQAGLDPNHPARATYRHGLYATANTDGTYAELVHHAEQALRFGEHVVLDASWTSARHRALATDLAERTHAELIELRCDAPHAVAARRILHRRRGPSDATLAVASAMERDADPWPDAVVIDTTRTPTDSLALGARAWEDATRDDDRRNWPARTAGTGPCLTSAGPTPFSGG